MSTDAWLSVIFVATVAICYGSLIWQVNQIQKVVDQIINEMEKRDERNRNNN